MTKGDIVLITFPFTDLSSAKLRPAVILFDTATDVLLNANLTNGLRKDSLIKNE